MTIKPVARDKILKLNIEKVSVIIKMIPSGSITILRRVLIYSLSILLPQCSESMHAIHLVSAILDTAAEIIVNANTSNLIMSSTIKCSDIINQRLVILSVWISGDNSQSLQHDILHNCDEH